MIMTLKRTPERERDISLVGKGIAVTRSYAIQEAIEDAQLIRHCRPLTARRRWPYDQGMPQVSMNAKSD